MKIYTWEVASLGPVSVIYCSLTKSCPYLVYRIFTQFLLFVSRLDDLSFDHISKSVAIERFVIEFRKTRVEVDFS